MAFALIWYFTSDKSLMLLSGTLILDLFNFVAFVKTIENGWSFKMINWKSDKWVTRNEYISSTA
eukprot:CAMPEP_0116969846 /NCGR_PEP_ID=MMETSP0467-20121206/52193_1 /TAXON_ID=283647 /ORGANISM="Mesodinium pulex, Strain SPMC105" /LENGTH=63 /DNA_ID=CAMNT_0004660631 /DNA_START=496 /DNA_END=683 /DNA_ORIENTATION=+